MKNICIFITVLMCAPLSASAATGDYAHYWNFDEGTGRSVNDFVLGAMAQNGVLTGSSTGFGWASGKIGNGLGMDGASGTGVALPDGALKGSTAALSVWFKLNNFTDRNVILSGRSTSDRYIYMALFVDLEGRPTLTWRTSSSDTEHRMQLTKPLNKNEWYHLVLTTDGQGYRAYVNGEEIGTAGENNGRWFANFTNHTLSYRIGMADTAGVAGSLDGYIDDVRVWERALAKEEALALYDETNAGRPTIPQAALPQISFTASSGNVATGSQVMLNWNVTGAVTCTAADGWTGDVGLSGSRTFTVTGDTTYTLTCTGQGGSANSSVRVVAAGGSGTTASLTVEQTYGGTSSTQTSTTVTSTTGGQTMTTMSDVARQAKIAEIKAMLVQLYAQLLELLKAQLAAKQAGS